MKRFIISLIILSLSIAAATVNDVFFQKKLGEIQEHLERAFVISLEGEAEELNEITKIITQEIEKNTFLCTLTVPHGEYESLGVNASRLKDCLLAENIHLYTELCSECLRQSESLKEGSKFSLKNII